MTCFWPLNIWSFRKKAFFNFLLSFCDFIVVYKTCGQFLEQTPMIQYNSQFVEINLPNRRSGVEGQRCQALQRLWSVPLAGFFQGWHGHGGKMWKTCSLPLRLPWGPPARDIQCKKVFRGLQGLDAKANSGRQECHWQLQAGQKSHLWVATSFLSINTQKDRLKHVLLFFHVFFSCRDFRNHDFHASNSWDFAIPTRLEMRALPAEDMGRHRTQLKGLEDALKQCRTQLVPWWHNNLLHNELWRWVFVQKTVNCHYSSPF